MNEYEIAFWCGLAIAALWILAYVLCWCGQWAWAWMDDSKPSSVNLITKYLGFRAGYEYIGEFWKWKTPSRENTDYLRFKHQELPIIFSTFIPIIAVLCFNFYTVFLVALATVGLAWLARFGRRNQKLFDKHITDKEAHK